MKKEKTQKNTKGKKTWTNLSTWKTKAMLELLYIVPQVTAALPSCALGRNSKCLFCMQKGIFFIVPPQTMSLLLR